ncbi:MAG: TolC family outer membrane protein [Stellaceae bacterium]
MRHGWLLILLALSVSSPGAGARAETLVEALTSAYATNADLLAARARLRATDEQVPQAVAAWRPTVNLTSSVGNQDYLVGTGSLLPTSFSYRQWSFGGGVKLDWPLYQGGRRQADLARAKQTVRAARADLLGTEQNVLLEAATSYEEVLRTRSLVKLDQEIEHLLERLVRATTTRQQAGQLTQTDVYQAATKLAAARVSQIGAEGDAAAAVARYTAAVGDAPPADLAVPSPPPGLPASAAQAVKLAVANDPTVVASLGRADAAKRAIAVARADLMPSVSLSARFTSDQGETFPTVPARGYSAQVDLTVPLYQSGAAASRLRQAEESASESEVQTWSSRRDARKNAQSADSQWRAAIAQEAQQREQVRLAQIAYQDVLKEAALGAKSVFELLSQLQDFYNARASEVNARYNAAVRAYQLLVAIGRFTAADLHLPTPIYNPIAHYRKVRDQDGALLPWVKPLLENGPR